MMQNASISCYNKLNFQVNNQVCNPNNDPPFHDMIKVNCAAVVYHKRSVQSLLDMLLIEPVIVPQVINEVEDSNIYNIGESMVADSEFVVKEKASKQGKKQKIGSSKTMEGRKKKFAKPTDMTFSATNPYEGNTWKIIFPMNNADVFIILSMLLAPEVRQRVEANDNDGNIESFFTAMEDDNMGDLLSSDIEVDEDECGENGDDEYKIHCQNVLH
eukprot:15365207-Ditylum_brightwellii.AAC.1